MRLATWQNISRLETQWEIGNEDVVAHDSSKALNEVLGFVAIEGPERLDDELLVISAILCLIGKEPSSVGTFVAASATMKEYLYTSGPVEKWAGMLFYRKKWEEERQNTGETLAIQVDQAVQRYWLGQVDVMAAGEAINKCTAGTMWDTDRNFDATYLANLFHTCAVLEKWSDEQKVEAYQRTWNLFQWFIAWGSFTEFTAALQALEAEEQ